MNHSIVMPDKPGSRAASTAQHSRSYSAREGSSMIAFENDQRVQVVDFCYPDEGEDEEAPVVRDSWTDAPLYEKCQRRLASIPSERDTTALILSKRLTVLQAALAEAVTRQDYDAICKFAMKAKGTAERLAAEERRYNAPGVRETFGDLLLIDDADRTKVVIQFSTQPDLETRKWVRICGFAAEGDGVTFSRRRTFRRGANVALEQGRICVNRIEGSRV